MPMKGWANLSVREETYHLLEKQSQLMNTTISALLYEIAPLLPKLIIIKTIKEESLKTALIRAQNCLNNFIAFHKTLSKKEGIFGQEYVSYDTLMNICVPYYKSLPSFLERLPGLVKEVENEVEKISNILEKIGYKRERFVSLPLIPKKEQLPALWILIEVNNLIISLFGKERDNLVFAIEDLKQFISQIPELQTTIMILEEIENFIEQFEKWIEEVRKHLYEKATSIFKEEKKEIS